MNSTPAEGESFADGETGVALSRAFSVSGLAPCPFAKNLTKRDAREACQTMSSPLVHPTNI